MLIQLDNESKESKEEFLSMKHYMDIYLDVLCVSNPNEIVSLRLHEQLKWLKSFFDGKFWICQNYAGS